MQKESNDIANFALNSVLVTNRGFVQLCYEVASCRDVFGPFYSFFRGWNIFKMNIRRLLVM